MSIDTNMPEVGRPTKFKEDVYPKQAYKLCLLGATDAELADFFEVHEDTINEWKKVYEEFSVSIKKGKFQADSEVAHKLYKRATGYQHPDVDVRAVEGEIVITPLIKHYAPDTAAAIFWLKNRQKNKWMDKQVHSNDPDNPMPDVTIFQLPDNGRD